MWRALAGVILLAAVGSLVPPAGTGHPCAPPAAASAALLTTWERRYDNNGSADLAWDIAETPQGDYVIVGATGPTPCVLGCNWDGWVVKTDAQGNVLWTRQVGGNGADLLTSVATKDDDYIVAGSKYVFPYARQAWLLRIASDGRVVWERTLGGNRDDSGNEILVCPDGNLLFIGNAESYSADGNSDVWLVKLSPNGTTLWTKTLDLGDEDLGTSIIPLQGNRFLAATVTCTANCGGLLQQGFATYMVLDSAGNILKTRTFADGPKNKFLAARPTADGGAVLVGATSVAEQFPSEDTWIVKLDANADVAWTRIIRSRGRYDGAHDILQLPDGGYVVAAYTQAYQTPQMDFDNFWMARLGPDGHLLWSWLWGGADNDDAYAVIRASDGSIVLAGFVDAVSWPLTEIPGPSDFYVVKTTAERERLFLPAVFSGRR